jgi:hypothetical protein
MQTEQRPTTSSGLLDKAREVGLSLPQDLERLAIMRGCGYYDRDLPPRVPPLGEVAFSNGELAVALMVPSLHPSAREIRLAAAMLGAPDVDAQQVSALAVREKCVDIVGYIARCGRRFESDNIFWQNLLGLLPKVSIDTNKLPHPTRFVEMTGIDRGRIGTFTRWIRARQAIAAIAA